MPLTPFVKPFFEYLKEKNWPSILILCLVGIGITLWISFNNKDAQNDQIQEKCTEVERHLNAFWQKREDSIVRVKNIEILETNKAFTLFKDQQFAKLEERLRQSERTDRAEKRQVSIFKKERQQTETTSKKLDSASKQF